VEEAPWLPLHPRARTKGKLERGVGYVRGNFWVRVSEEVRSGKLELPGLNGRAREWTEGVANQRVHGTHGEVVAKRYAEEEPLLGKVHGRVRYDTDYHSLRSAGKDARLSYRGKLYQLSRSHAFEEVEVIESLEGKVGFRSKEGQLLPAKLVQAGSSPVLTVERVASEELALPKQEASKLLRLIPREGLDVEERSLSVYEEVAYASPTR